MVEIEKLLKDSLEIFQKNIVAFVVATFIVMIPSILTSIIPIAGLILFILLPALTYGLTSMAIKATKGETVEINDISVALKDSNKLIQSLILAIVGGILVVIGLILLIIPGLVLAVLFTYSMILLVIREYGAIDALKESVDIVKNNVGETILIVVIVAVLNIIGGIIHISFIPIGTLLTMPFGLIAYVLVFNSLTDTKKELITETVSTE